MNAAAATDTEMIAALEASPNFTVVTDADHLAYLLDVDQDEKAPADTMADDVATIRDIILARIERRAPFGGMTSVTVAQVWDWWECDGYGAVACERAIKSLIAGGAVQEAMHYGALAFDARR